MNPKVLVIVGPTASGKSDLAVELAKRFNGEIISADSRQVYRGMNIGTGKITKNEMKGVRHHLLDVADPKKRFTVIQFRALAEKAIADILRRGKLPIICGGTGFYVDALVNGTEFPIIGANQKLRAKLVRRTADELFTMLKRLDSVRAAAIVSNNSERHNRRRLIRAIELAVAASSQTARRAAKKEGRPPAVSGSLPAARSTTSGAGALASSFQHKYDALWIGMKPPQAVLKEHIGVRLLKRLKTGMIAEARRLHSDGLSWKRMEELGLEYRYMARFLTHRLTKPEMTRELEMEIWHYAKRQMTWFKRNPKIRWYASLDQSLTRLVKRAIIQADNP